MIKDRDEQANEEIHRSRSERVPVKLGSITIVSALIGNTIVQGFFYGGFIT